MTQQQLLRKANRMISTATQLQNEGRFEEAEKMLDEAETLVDQSEILT